MPHSALMRFHLLNRLCEATSSLRLVLAGCTVPIPPSRPAHRGDQSVMSVLVPAACWQGRTFCPALPCLRVAVCEHVPPCVCAQSWWFTKSSSLGGVLMRADTVKWITGHFPPLLSDRFRFPLNAFVQSLLHCCLVTAVLSEPFSKSRAHPVNYLTWYSNGKSLAGKLPP